MGGWSGRGFPSRYGVEIALGKRGSWAWARWEGDPKGEWEGVQAGVAEMEL